MTWGDLWSTWAQSGLAGLFPMRSRQFSRIGRVQAVHGVPRSAPLDMARWFGEEIRFSRPDVNDIPSQDIVLFHDLLGLRPTLDSPKNLTVVPELTEEGTQADRIHATLGHMRAIKGL